MPNREIQISVAPDLTAKGIKVCAATFSIPNNPRRRGATLEKHIKEIIESLNIEELLQSPILEEYRKLQREAGIQNPIAPAESLLKYIQSHRKLFEINRVVDCYNIVSAERGLSIGAHDLDKIQGDVELKKTDGTEKYVPLGQETPEKVNPGEYGAMDDEKMICRLDIKQCDETKCGPDTRSVFVYVQGNAKTSLNSVKATLEMVRDNIIRFCDGECLAIISPL